MATILDVARLANVSTATVSHVINKTRKVNPETIEKVEWAIRELDYMPNEQARSLKTGRSHLIGVLNYDNVDDYFSEVLSSLERTAYEAHYDVIIRHAEMDGLNEGDAISAWANKNIDGLIVNSPVVTDQFNELIKKLNCPCVLLHVRGSFCQCDTIRINDLEATCEAIQYLIGLNHTRIACLSGIVFPSHTAADRHAGYEKALQEAGLPIRDEYFVVSDYTIEEGYQLFKELMALEAPPTAIFTYSDPLAMGALRAAADLKLEVPEDVSIIGFDDIYNASYFVPRLTTIHQDKQKIGELAIKQLLKRIQSPGLPKEDIVVNAHLSIRESTGPAKQ